MGLEEILMWFKTMEAWDQNTTNTTKVHKDYSKTAWDQENHHLSDILRILLMINQILLYIQTGKALKQKK